MARPKKSETNTTSVVEEEKTTEVEKAETPAETESAVVKTEKTESESKAENLGDNDKVVIKCEKYAGKSISLPTRVIQLDETGKCEVTGPEANRLLTIPGYELVK